MQSILLYNNLTSEFDLNLWSRALHEVADLIVWLIEIGWETVQMRNSDGGGNWKRIGMWVVVVLLYLFVSGCVCLYLCDSLCVCAASWMSTCEGRCSAAFKVLWCSAENSSWAAEQRRELCLIGGGEGGGKYNNTTTTGLNNNNRIGNSILPSSLLIAHILLGSSTEHFDASHFPLCRASADLSWAALSHRTIAGLGWTGLGWVAKLLHRRHILNNTINYIHHNHIDSQTTEFQHFLSVLPGDERRDSDSATNENR